MKKSKLFLMSLLLIPALAACNNYVYDPGEDMPYPGDPFNQNEGADPALPDIDAEFNMTVYFYLDYSHSDEPLYEMRWYMLAPLEKIPDEAKLEDKDAPDPLYWKFLGYSEYPTCLDESKLWNFETDYKLSNVLKLYGIWVNR